MADLLSSEEFPPLSTKVSTTTSPPALSYSNVVAAPRPGNAFKLSSSSLPDDLLDFNEVHVKVAEDEWSLSLIGYSIGRRPYYESLLSAIRKLWKLKGTMKLLSLSDGFFMQRFSALEDFEMALNGGVWFFLGKPFVLQKWAPNFKPVREEFSSIPIWFKILDLPLPCWTPEGISRIATKIGTPIAVDDLTADKTRLTYAHVCVQVTKDCLYPETIPITILGEPFSLKIQYEWKPMPCEFCGSIVHSPEFCPSKPPTVNTVVLPKRGRSTNRKPPRPFIRTQNIQSTQAPPPSDLVDALKLNPSSSNSAIQESSNPVDPKHPSPPQNIIPAASTLPETFPSQPQVIVIPATDTGSREMFSNIPNLNSPTEEALPSSTTTVQPQQDKVISPNKFALLQDSNVEDVNYSNTSSASSQTRNLPATQTKATRSKQPKKTPAHNSKSK
ncbi:hypothetical protein KFK09_028452 [Dendrobium nobile]|uniref:DUF4283 domain-containing protein n=1 Tax=Dendrobium nobile TaxID=94219 RepID=A0A8T3A7K1_DENNO|nr:hypothetical protein KFK09_028452 [Dendrobium nobile]